MHVPYDGVRRLRSGMAVRSGRMILAILGSLVLWLASASPGVAQGASDFSADEDPVIAPLPARVIDSQLYVAGISRSNQMLRIYRQGAVVAETRSNEVGDFAAGIALDPGSNSIKVVAVDFGREGASSQSVAVEYAPWLRGDSRQRLDTATPSQIDSLTAPVLDQPASPATTNPITVTGTATPGVTIILFVNTRQVQTGTVGGDGHFSLHVPLVDGANSIYGIAQDTSGQSPASNTVAVDYTNQVSRTQSGTLSQDTAWTAGDGTPYSITGNVTVPAGVTLWLEAGATLKFTSSFKLLVQGTLVVWGSSTQRVVVTSGRATQARGDWAGIEIATTATNVSIDYAQVEYATNGIYFNGGTGTVTNSLIRNSTEGIYVVAPGASPTVTNGNEITANVYGVFVQGNSNAAQNPMPVVTGNSIYSNTTNDYRSASFGNPGTTVLNATGNWWGTTDPSLIATHIFDWTDSTTSAVVNYGQYLGAAGGNPVFTGPTLDGQISTNTTLSAQQYQVLGTVEVASGVTLTIPGGATLLFPANYVLRIKGTLIVQGTSSQRVVFTSGKSTPARGDWAGIEITSIATGVSIDYAQIEYATNGIYFNGGNGTVTHSLIRNNTQGINVAAPSASPTITNGNEITANTYGLYVQGNSNAAQNPMPVVAGNSIYANTSYDYRSLSFGNPGFTVLNATGNWWGTSDPEVIASHINDWTDATSAGVVDYGHYLDSAGGAVVFSGPTLDGQIVTSTTLTAQQYQVLGIVEVAQGATLTIPAGATLIVTSNYVVRIKGTLVVQGSASQFAVFTSGEATPTRGDWAGIEITSTATGVSIDYAQIEYATNGLYFNGGNGAVTHSLIHNNTQGINVVAPSASPTITNGNEITANTYGLYVQGNSNAAQNPMPVVTGNSLYANTTYDYRAFSFGNPGATVLNATGNWWGTADPVVIASHISDWTDTVTAPIVNYAGYLGAAGGTPVFPGPTLDGPIASNTTLTAQQYQVLGIVEVEQGATLTVPAGASLLFASNYTLRIKGTLVVQGTSTQRAVFTSGRTPPAAGNWAGIEITSTATGVSIDYAQIEYATNGLYFTGGNGTVTHSLIRNNTQGINVLAPNASPTITNGNEITANVYGLYVQGNSTAAQNPMPVVTGNSLYSNTGDDYRALSFGNAGTTVLNATGNWWGTTDAATIAVNIWDHTDSSSSPTVSFLDFLDGPGGSPFVAILGASVDQFQVKPLSAVVGTGTFSISTAATVTFEVHRDSDNAIVSSHSQPYSSGGTYPFSWDGTGTAGDTQPVGLYRMVFQATNGSSQATYDAPQPTNPLNVSGSVPQTYNPFRNEFWKIQVTMAPAGLLTLEIHQPNNGTLIFDELSNVYYAAGASWIYWDGRDPSGQILTQQVYPFFPPPIPLRPTAFVVSGTQTTITGTGAAPNIEVKSDPYLVTHSYEQISISRTTSTSTRT